MTRGKSAKKMLTQLPDELVTAILAQVPSRDPSSLVPTGFYWNPGTAAQLRLVCKRFCKLINAKAYLKEVKATPVGRVTLEEVTRQVQTCLCLEATVTLRVTMTRIRTLRLPHRRHSWDHDFELRPREHVRRYCHFARVVDATGTRTVVMSDKAVEQLRSCCADPPQYPQTSDSRWLWEDRGFAVLDNADGFFLVPGGYLPNIVMRCRYMPSTRDLVSARVIDTPLLRLNAVDAWSGHQSLDLECVELELSQVDDDDPPAQTPAMSFGGCRDLPVTVDWGKEGRALLGDIRAMLQRGSGPPASSTPVLHYPGFRAAEQEARDFAEEVAEDERAGAEFV